jgi:hypothetical protein
MKRPSHVSHFYLQAAKGRLIGTRVTHDGLNYIREISGKATGVFRKKLAARLKQ